MVVGDDAARETVASPVIGEPITLPIGATIDPAEISYDWARSGGPGGQNVNKVNTRVTLLFNVAQSPAFTEAQKAQITRRLATRINRGGVLRVVAARHRTQLANKRAALERFVELLTEALHRDPPRKRTRVPAGARKKRLADKTHRGRVKDARRWSPGDE